MMQALNNVDTFRNTIEEKVRNSRGNEENIVNTLNMIFKALQTKQLEEDSWFIDLRDTQIFTILGFNPDVQSDPRELLTQILDKIMQVQPTIHELFNYNEIKTVFEDNNRVTMKSNILTIYPIKENTTPHRDFRLDELIQEEISKIDLDERNEIPKALTTLEFGQEVLCINLSRTTIDNEKLFYTIKLNTYLNIEGMRYTLRATIVHKGHSANRGHFITYTLKDNEVFCINDAYAWKTNMNANDKYLCFDEPKGDARTCMVFYEKTTQNSQPFKAKITCKVKQMPNITPRQSIISVTEEDINDEQSSISLGKEMIDPSILILNNEITQELTEVHSPHDFQQMMSSLKTKYQDRWGTMKDIFFTIPKKDINLITYGILKGMLPTTQREKLCGYPRCRTIVKNNKGRCNHWHAEHIQESPEYNYFKEIMEIFGADIVTITSNEDESEYIKTPLFQCPFRGCSFVAHQPGNMNDHFKHVHKEKYKEAINLSWLQRHLWFMLLTNNKQIMENIIYSGKVLKCNECGWCSTTTTCASKHPTKMHREYMTEDRVFFEESNIEYEFFQRDGQSISPFVGEIEDDNEIYKIKKCDANEGSENSKEEVIRYITKEGNAESEDNKDTSSTLQEEINCTPDEQAQDQQDSSSDESEEEDMTDEEIEKGLAWNREYSNEEALLPKFSTKNKQKLREAMEKVLEEKVIPTLKVANKAIPKEAPKEEIINGYISYCFHCIIEETKKALGINRRNHTTYRPQQENKLDLMKKSRDAGSRIVACIEEINVLRKQDLEAGVLNNREEEEIDKICSQSELLSNKMKRHLFNTVKLSRETIKQKINEIIEMGSQTNITQYIENASEEITTIEDKRRKAFTRKVRNLFSISPKRAMRYYVDSKDTPNCTIPIEQIRKELMMRWIEEDFEIEIDENGKWESSFSLTEEDKRYMVESLQNKEVFEQAIRSRDITSAHGPDGIGYWALMLAPEQGAEMMVAISKLMLKYKMMPSQWNQSKTILLYKHGSPNEVNNWRPLNIAPCLYRVWSCALANTIQSINKRNQIFHPHQKGFIAGVDGCMEHSNMINEIIHDANRSRRNLYICSIDLKDAFGSIPHGYILHTLNEMNFPQEIQDIIEDSYCRSEAKIHIEGKVSKSFDIKRGVKQGCPVSPLIFNLCLNPLLTEVDYTHEGYRLDETTKIVIQAYADDIVLFSEKREEMEDILQTVQEFLNYSKLKVNVNKCKMMSYILSNGRRYFEEENFTLGSQPIPNATLEDNIRYLGTDVTTASSIRINGTEHVINEMETLIDKIGDSVLSLSQKVYAVRTFAIPRLDYLLTNGRVSLNKMNSIDMRIRSIINKHVKGVHLPKNIFYTHWKDGGFSLQSLHDRTLALRIKTFMT